MVEHLSATQWCARADALWALKISQHDDPLEVLNKDDTQIPSTQFGASGFLKTLENFQITLLSVIWNNILKSWWNKTARNQDLDLFDANKELETLSSFLNEKRDLFDVFESKALKLAEKKSCMGCEKRKLLLNQKDRSIE